ncbi:hypothetical protein BP6252_13353 [Coleophoma cylindrospora]|uniref:Acetyl-CoA synthetase-like protein n=1 Tax=Coleophoma cylindrospora TaxID=1849047 RepID=A0A3D8QB06_9HELO|nr:hypothetical protein BP6252_13353 [Coleophoma cylindrospora]
MAEPVVLVEHISSSIVKIILNRPKAMNALNTELLRTLVTTLREHQDAPVILLEGAGDRSFCAGEDLKQTLAPKTGTAEELRHSFDLLQDLTRLTSSSKAIVVAAVQGYAIGGGAEIALAADFVIGGPKAVFRFPEVPIGHAVTGGISLRLVQMVGLLRAKELFLCGRFVDAEESLKIGLLSEMVENPKERALELAQQLAKLPRISASSSKSSLERAVFPNLESVLADEVNVANYCFAQSDAEKAFTDFAARKSKTNGSPEEVPNDQNLKTNKLVQATPGMTAKPATQELPGDLNTALERAVQQFPNAPFIRFSGSDTSFKEFDQAVAKLAGGLRSIGICRDDKVMVMMRNSLEMVQTWFASNRLGAVWVPINSELKGLTLKNVIEAGEPKIAIVDAEFYSEIKSCGKFNEKDIFVKGGTPELPSINQIYSSGSPVHKPENVSPAAVSAYLYTSGSTGRSKPCVLSHQYFINQASCAVTAFKIVPEDVLYCPFPLFHADATALTTVPALLTGCTAALSVRFSVSKFWDEIRETGSTIYDFMGATLALLFKCPPTSNDRNHKVRLAWGVPVPTWAPEYESRFGHPIVELYGSVEAGLPVMQTGKRVVGSCGTVLPGYTVQISDEYDMPVPCNVTGNILVRSTRPNAFFKEYFNAPTQTLAATRNLWLHTGDQGHMDEQGNLYFHGRVKDVIRRRGENVNAFEVEEELLRHPQVITAAAFAIPADLGEGTEDDIKVVVVVREENVKEHRLTEIQLWEWAKANMAKFQVPAVIQFVPTLKKTPTGKLDKLDLIADGGVRFSGR